MSNAILLVGDSVSNSNLFYKTHFLAGDPFVYAETGEQKLLVVNSMEQGRAQKESKVDAVRTFDQYGYRELTRELNDRTAAFSHILQRILNDLHTDAATVEGDFPVMYADALRANGVALTVDPHLLVSERRIKSGEEISAIEEAQRATERAMARAIETIGESEIIGDTLHYAGIPLTSERLRSEIEALFLREDMDSSHTPITAGGPGAADPHWLGSGPLRAGQAIVLDLFPRSKRTRYFADMTRTVVKGQPDETLIAMYDATSRALDAALSQIRAGANGKDVHTAADDVFKDAGFHGEGPGPRYIHSTGHGVGLDIHEGPSLGSQDVELQPGDVVTVEPGLYDPTIGAVRLEDLVVVTDDGYTNLTRFPRQFIL
jgi:Xaa-Pro aminopeptidase